LSSVIFQKEGKIMFLQILTVGELGCNCVVLGCERTMEGVIIDPGGDVAEIKAVVKEAGLKILYLLHTHAHLDHIGGAAELKKAGYGKILLHRDDEFLYQKIVDQGRMFGLSMSSPEKVDEYLSEEKEISFGDIKLKVIHTPGHSPGGCCFLAEEQGVLFCGDTLFHRSIGRTDLDGGDMGTLIKSIKSKLFTLDKDYRIIPGHGAETTLFGERENNPFLLGGFFI
jgi:glyoxylase-like metal-dependent hydrolase (beta-lactamase superfamily II)